MLKGSDQKVEDLILSILAKKPDVSVRSICDELGRTQHNISLQGIYRAIRKLTDEGVLIKQSKQVHINFSWLLQLSEFVHNLLASHVEGVQGFSRILPRTHGEKVRWEFQNIYAMNTFRLQLLLAIALRSPGTPSLSYGPYGWTELVPSKKDEQLRTAYYRTIDKEFGVIPNRTHLESFTSRFHLTSYENIEYYYPSKLKSPVTKSQNLYLKIIGPYVISLKVESELQKKIQCTYDAITSEHDLGEFDFFEEFPADGKLKLIVEYNEKKSKTFYKKYKRLFGPLDR